MASLNDIPDEIIRQILFHVRALDNLSCVQLLSHRLNHIANDPLLWRYYCRASFHYWHPSHDFPRKLRQRAPEVDWKALWLYRARGDVRISNIFDDLLDTKVCRMANLKKICLQGYDAKDFLLEQCHTDDSAEDVLARRYYANMALDSIHRGIAIDVWSKYQGVPMSQRDLEKALGAFDMFVLHDQPQDLEYISASFDTLADQFRSEHPNLEDMPTRPKALGLVRWLRAKNLTGMENPEANYRNIRNCFIGHALSDPEHPSLPIISSAIFCAVAERLDMTASCCAFPSHVHASVLAPPGQSLDGAVREPGVEPGVDIESMYLDPYGSDDEITVQDLRLRLVEFGWAAGSDAFLRASPVPVIVQRAAQNIKTAYSAIQDLRQDDPTSVERKSLRAGHPELNLEAAFYGSLWAQLLTKQASNLRWDGGLNTFLNRFALTWSEDAWIVEKYLVPLYDTFIESHPEPRHRVGWENVRDILAMLRNLDQRKPTISRRYTREIHDKVHYKIGEVFRHKRYGYLGVINGWAATGTTGLPTPHYMTADESEDDDDGGDGGGGGEEAPSQELPRRKSRAYYTCLRSTVDRLRVAQENIEIVTDPDLIPETLLFMAGKFFKRFDRESCRFVSNIKEFYPDD